MKRSIRLTALGLAAALGLSIGSMGIARAGSEGRRNTAIGLGAVAVYGLLTKKPLVAGLAGAGAYYSYQRYRKARRNERYYGYGTAGRGYYDSNSRLWTHSGRHVIDARHGHHR